MKAHSMLVVLVCLALLASAGLIRAQKPVTNSMAASPVERIPAMQPLRILADMHRV